jgi:hypothetical protein
MSSKARKGKTCVPSKSKSRAPRKRSRLTLTTATAICTFLAAALAALTALAGDLHHLVVWLHL